MGEEEEEEEEGEEGEPEEEEREEGKGKEKDIKSALLAVFGDSAVTPAQLSLVDQCWGVDFSANSPEFGPKMYNEFKFDSGFIVLFMTYKLSFQCGEDDTFHPSTQETGAGNLYQFKDDALPAWDLPVLHRISPGSSRKDFFHIIAVEKCFSSLKL
ncbi:hypothetical protein STEG23_026387 [Scotinomys teguina]